MGPARARDRRRHHAVWRAVRPHAARPEAPARLPLDREHRHHPARAGDVDAVHWLRARRGGRARADCRAVPHDQPRRVQGAAVSGRRHDPAFERAARSERDGRADPQDAQHRLLLSHRRTRHFCAPAAQRLCFRMSHVPDGAAGAAARARRDAKPGAAVGGGRDAGALERIGMAWLAAGCFVLGLLPSTFLQMLNRVSVSLSGGGLPAEALESSWLWLVPTAAEQASYSPVIFLSVIVAVTLLAFLLVRGLYHGRVRYSDPWDCGYPEQSSRMQDTADAFGQPIRHVFGPLYLMKRHLPAAEDRARRYSVQIEDRHWYLLYLPIARLAEFVSSRVGLLQRGRISIYLLYSFLTLIALLVFVR